MMLHLTLWIYFITQLQCASSQRFGVAIGNNNNNNNDGGNVVRRERYEYNPPPHGMNQRGREGGPFDGLLPGIVLTFASSALQWWNEGHAVRNARMLSAAEREVIEINHLDEWNDGKLVHITGYLSTNGGLIDPIHGLHRPDTLQLIRETEQYQWKETKSESRTRVSETETRVVTEYTHHTEWSKRYIDSNRFEASGGHYNPPSHYKLGKDKMTVNDAKLPNGLIVPAPLVDQIAQTDIMIKLADTTNIQSKDNIHPTNLGMGEDLPYLEDAVISSNVLCYSESNRRNLPSYLSSLDDKDKQLKIANKRTEVVRFAPQPQVGDVRVKWREVAPPADGVSILARQENNQLLPWYYSNEEKGYIYSLFTGQYTAKEMITKHISKHKLITKILRIGGWIGSYIGINLILSCIPAMISVLPFGIGTFMQPLARVATSTIALAISAGLSGIVISAAWLRFRPLLSSAIGLISSLFFFGPFIYARLNRSPEVIAMDAKL